MDLAANLKLGTKLLGLGQWQEGHTLDLSRYELYPWWEVKPRWKGEDLSHKHVLLWGEAGWGDKICSLRYIDPIFKKYPGVKVTIGMAQRLVSLVRSSFPELPAGYPPNLPPWRDYASSLLDVPLYLGLTWDTVPRPQKYLTVDPGLVKRWSYRLNDVPKRPNIGLCWETSTDASRTPPVEYLKKLGQLPVNLISLQVPPIKAPEGVNIIDFGDEIIGWSNTGAVIENCNLVVSIDTGVAHLAGALGKPVWVIVASSQHWPWLAPHIPPTPSYSIWYPSMTLFRQQGPDDWEHVDRIIERLESNVLC